MGQSQAVARAISTMPPENFQVHPASVVILPRNGLELPRRLSFDKWVSIGKQLSAINTSSAWCLGDWLSYGIEAFSGRYKSAVEQTGLDYQTLRNYVWVAKRFPLSRRRAELSFGHHAEMAALAEPEQDFWLRKSEELGWSVKQLRQEIRASLRERKSGGAVCQEAGQSYKEDEIRTEPGLVKLDIHIRPHQFEACQTAASKLGLDIEEWVVMTLTKAARDILASAAMTAPSTVSSMPAL